MNVTAYLIQHYVEIHVDSMPPAHANTMNKLRIAFLTTEYISDKKKGGGLGTYLGRIAKALYNEGHEPEIFLTSTENSKYTYHNCIRVNSVKVHNDISRICSFALAKLMFAPLGGPAHYLLSAKALYEALHKRHTIEPFDFVQSTNCSATGLFVNRIPNLLHVIRLSSKRDLWLKEDSKYGLGAYSISLLERECIRRANIAYAPSNFIAKECRKDWRRDVAVVRPPVFIDKEPIDKLPFKTPEKYLFHFGQISHRKGSDLIAKALPIAWEHCPDLKMVWAGRINNKPEYLKYVKLWGDKSNNVLYLGALPKEQLYSVLQNALASVLPSRVDNLPNTVIESLLLHVPVIGSKGASIDELLEDGVTGHLVEIGNASDLASKMLQYWMGDCADLSSEDFENGKLKSLNPKVAVHNLLEAVGYNL